MPKDMHTDPSLADLLELFKKDLMLTLNCHHLATIQSFDAEKQTVQATINYKQERSFRDADGSYGTMEFDYPILIDCPVIVLGGGSASMRFPIAKGDGALILFNDRDMDNWLASEAVVSPRTERYHSLTDGVAIVGLRSLKSPLKDYSPDRAELVHGKAQVSLSAAKVRIKNDTQSLAPILQTLVSQVKELAEKVSALSVVGPVNTSNSTASCTVSPGQQTALNSLATAIGTTATKLGGLLE
jgi:hypothetical protein